jgi:hypothetical protein
MRGGENDMTKLTPEIVKNCNKLASQFEELVDKYGMTKDVAFDFLLQENNKKSNLTFKKESFAIALYIGFSMGVK